MRLTRTKNARQVSEAWEFVAHAQEDPLGCFLKSTFFRGQEIARYMVFHGLEALLRGLRLVAKDKFNGILPGGNERRRELLDAPMA